ncbi:MAG TPA: hypothetical protein VI233_13295 [Puia sp.]
MKSAFIRVMAVAFVLFTACKKHSDPPKPKSTVEQMNGQWKVSEINENNMENGTLQILSMQGKPGDHFNFNLDGSIQITVLGADLNFPKYHVTGDSLFITNDLASDAFHIESLSNTTLNLHGKTGISPTNYVEIWYHLTK